jgi:hypothetical protein
MDARQARAQLAEVRRQFALLHQRTRDLGVRRAASGHASATRPREIPTGLRQEFEHLRGDFHVLERQGHKGAFDADAHTLFRERAEAFVAQLRAWEAEAERNDAPG